MLFVLLEEDKLSAEHTNPSKEQFWKQKALLFKCACSQGLSAQVAGFCTC